MIYWTAPIVPRAIFRQCIQVIAKQSLFYKDCYLHADKISLILKLMI